MKATRIDATLGNNMGTMLRNQLIAAALLAVIVISVIGGLALLGLDEPYAIVVGAIVAALVKADDWRIRRARRRALALTS